MRHALWFLGLFGLAVVLALFASTNHATVTIFWLPHRIDLSLNLVLVALCILFALLHFALKALSALFALPAQARQWRLKHQERVMYEALLEALSHWVAGRFLRAKKSAQVMLARESALARHGENVQGSARLRVLAHLLAAESSHSLQDRVERDLHFEQAIALTKAGSSTAEREGLLLQAVRWSLEDQEPSAAMAWLGQLSSGGARRTVALRLRLKVARLAGRSELALETARLLVKHRAFSSESGRGLLRSLAQEWLHSSTDTDQLLHIWQRLEATEQQMSEVACSAAGRWLRMGGSVANAFEFLLPVWEQMSAGGNVMSLEQKITMVRVMENGLSVAHEAFDDGWLARIESAHFNDPGDAVLQYLAGVACLHLQLWGKAQQLLQQSLPRLPDAGLQSRAWQMLAELAQSQGKDVEAATAWRNASLARMRPAVR